MTDVGSDADTVSTLFYKNKLYYYNSDKKLCSCTVKGKNGSVVGDVERFGWEQSISRKCKRDVTVICVVTSLFII